MRARFPLLLALGLLVGACGGTEVVAPSPSTPAAPGSGSPPSSPSFGPSPSSSPRPIPPAWAEPIERPLPAEDIPVDRLIPPGAEATGTRIIPPAAGALDQIVVTWSSGEDPFRQERGLAVWQRYPDRPSWSVAYAFLDDVDKGVLGIRVQLGDVTGDGREDLLSFEDQGGSGGCGVWRIIATGEGTGTEIFHRRTCDTNIAIGAGTLVIDASVYAPGDSHCCPSATRTTTLRWDGSTWQVVDRVVTENPSG
ncbi:MAG: hypothetical protein HYU54_10805 [Actinobacteria bacterium]|nr:hypothetical protein [Actinomycetota bacterium]